jgi:hypothetical protein
MAKASKSKDPNISAFNIVQRATGETSAPFAALDNAELRKQLMREMGRRGGQKGGKARAESLTKTERSEIAKKAAQARWKS